MKTAPTKSKGKPRGLRRDRDCFTCKERDVKCDLNRPSCSQCVEAGVSCAGYPTRVIWADGLTSKSNSGSTSTSRSTSPTGSSNKGVSKKKSGRTASHSVTGGIKAGDITSSSLGTIDSTAITSASVLSSSSTTPLVTTVQIQPQMMLQPHPTSSAETITIAPASVPTPAVVPETVPTAAMVTTTTNAVSSLPPGHGGDIVQNVDSVAIGPASLSYLTDRANENDESETKNFAWGVKAILTAFKHARDNDSALMSRSSGKEKTSTLKQQEAGGERKEEDEELQDHEQSKVLSTIWKFVSTFLSNNEHTDSEFEFHSLELKAAAIQELKEFINEGILEAVFAILAFTYFDVCQGSFGDWSKHLKGARSLLDLHCPTKEKLEDKSLELPGLQEAVTLLTWYDVTGAVATKDRELIFADWHRDVIDDKFFKYIGCPKQCFSMMANVVKRKTSNFSHPETTEDAILLPLDGIMHAPPADGSLTVEQVAANCWGYTCLLSALEYPAPDQPVPQSVTTLVGKICDGITNLPRGSHLSQHLAVAVYVSGLSAKEPEHRLVVKDYWRFWRSVKFPLYPDALEKCENRWVLMDI